MGHRRLIHYEDLRGNLWEVTGRLGCIEDLVLVAAGEPADGEPDTAAEALAELGAGELRDMERCLGWQD